MVFLIEYDRKKGEILKLQSYPETERLTAQNDRLDLELSLIRDDLDYEVVLLEANTENDLRQTHRRYFESLREIAST